MKANKQEYDEKTTKFVEKFKAVIASITDQNNNLKYSQTQKDSLKPPNPTTLVPHKRRDPPLDGVKSTKLIACGI